MTYTLGRALFVLGAHIALPSAAMAEDYSTVSNSAFAGYLMTGSTILEAGKASAMVQMYPQSSLAEQNRDSFSQRWYQQDIDDDTFRIKLRGAALESCLALVEHDGLDVIVAVAPCTDDPAHVWSASDSQPTRLYNSFFSQARCMTAVNSGQYSGALTMTECGTGDVSTELWTSTDVAQ